MFSSFLGYGLQTCSLNSYANGRTSGRYLGLEDTRKLGPHNGISGFVETRASHPHVPCMNLSVLPHHDAVQRPSPGAAITLLGIPSSRAMREMQFQLFTTCPSHGHLSERQTANSPKHHSFGLGFSQCYMIKEIDIWVPRILPIPRFKLALEICHRAA